MGAAHRYASAVYGQSVQVRQPRFRISKDEFRMAADTQNHTFPPAIAKAVVQVMRSIGTLGKDQENKFDHYDYASIDDFIAARSRPLRRGWTGDHSRRSAGRGNAGGQQERRQADGDLERPLRVHPDPRKRQSFGPIYKTVAVQFNGAQAAGSAQSYALKQLMRGLFLIKTGDKDDPDEKGLDIASKGEQQTDLQKTANTIRKKIREADDPAKLGLVWSDCEMEREMIRGASESAHDFLEKEYRQRAKELENA
jgi:hypothetical protein